MWKEQQSSADLKEVPLLYNIKAYDAYTNWVNEREREGEKERETQRRNLNKKTKKKGNKTLNTEEPTNERDPALACLQG